MSPWEVTLWGGGRPKSQVCVSCKSQITRQGSQQQPWQCVIDCWLSLMWRWCETISIRDSCLLDCVKKFVEIHLKGLCACRLLKRRIVPRTRAVKEGELARENYTLTMFRGLCTFGRSLCDTLNDTCFLICCFSFWWRFTHFVLCIWIT